MPDRYPSMPDDENVAWWQFVYLMAQCFKVNRALGIAPESAAMLIDRTLCAYREDPSTTVYFGGSRGGIGDAGAHDVSGDGSDKK